MPTKSEEQAAIDAIKDLERQAYRRDGNSPVQAVDGPPAWNDLPEGDKLRLLGESVNFEGFEPDEAEDVMAQVADGADPADWMDGVGTDDTRGRVREQIEAIKREDGHDDAMYDKVFGRVEFVGRVVYGAWENVPEEEKLYILQNRPDWDGVSSDDKRELIGQEIDFSRISPEKQIEITGQVEVEHPMSPEGRSRLFHEWRDDASQKPLAEKGVDYSDRPYGDKGDYDRALREAAEQARYRVQEPDKGRDR